MNGNLKPIALTAVLAAALGWMCSSEAELPCAHAASRSAGGWEFAELASFQLELAVRATVRWEDEQNVFEANSYQTIGKKLKYELRRSDSTSLLNALGSDGWDIVNLTSFGNGSERVYTWTLRRPR